MKKPNEQMQMILDAVANMGPLPIESLSPELARQMPLPDRAAVAVYGHHFMKKAMAPMPMDVGKVENRLIPGVKDQLLVRIYTPKGDAPKEGWPVAVYYHGGGWVIATLDTYDASCRALCDGAKAVIVSVSYRQAPEHKWPAAPQDAFLAYQWVCANTKSFKGNPSRIAVVGESAGGNLATIVSIMARDQKIQAPVHQVLVYPVVDLANGPENESAIENANAKPLNKAMLGWFYNHYLPTQANRKDPMISPLYAELKGVAPATIIIAEIDPLRCEGKFYADALKAAGVPVHLQLFKGVTHEFFGLAGLVDEATDAVKLACEELTKAFEHAPMKRAA